MLCFRFPIAGARRGTFASSLQSIFARPEAMVNGVGHHVLALVLVTAIWPGVLHFFDNAYDIGDLTINTQWPTWPSKFVPIVGFSILWVRLMVETIAYMRLVLDPDTSR